MQISRLISISLIASALFGQQAFWAMNKSGSAPSGSWGTCNVSSGTVHGAVNSVPITLSHAIGAGDALIIVTAVNSTVLGNSVTGISAGGTYVSSGELVSLWNGFGWQTEGHVYPATATSGPVSINLGVTTADSDDVIGIIYDCPVVSGTPSVDVSISAADSALHDGNFAIPPAPSMTGTNAFIVTAASPLNDTMSGVSSPWTNSVFRTGYPHTGAASQVNVSSVLSPTWSTSGDHKWGASALSLTFNPTASVRWGILDGSGGTNGAPVSPANLAAGTFGASSLGTNPNSAQWTINQDASSITYSTAAHYGTLLHPAPRFFYSGNVYANASTVGFAEATPSTQGTVFTFPGNFATEPWLAASVSACAHRVLGIPVSAGQFDTVDSFTIGGGTDGKFSHFVTSQYRNPDGSQIVADTEFQLGADSAPNWNLTTGVGYWFCLQHNTGIGLRDYQAVYDEAGVQIGTTAQSVAQPGGYGAPTIIQWGVSGATDQPSGYTNYWGPITFCYAKGATCPLKLIP